MSFPSIVMIDPSREAAEMVRFALWRSNLRCCFQTCPDLNSARSCLLQRRRSGDGVTPSLILLESELDGSDGLDLLRELRTLPHLAQVPVVVFPSHEMEGERDALAAGATEYLPKPVDGEMYARSVVDLFQRWCHEEVTPQEEALTREAVSIAPARRRDDAFQKN
jgi:CheY-like chemotaxis protein